MKRSKPITRSETVKDALERFKKVSAELTVIRKDLEVLDKHSKCSVLVRFDVTQVEVYPLYRKSEGGCLKGYANIEIGGQLGIRGLRIIEIGEGELKVEYPPSPFPAHDGDTIIFTTSNELRDNISYSVLSMYAKLTK